MWCVPSESGVAGAHGFVIPARAPAVDLNLQVPKWWVKMKKKNKQIKDSAGYEMLT